MDLCWVLVSCLIQSFISFIQGKYGGIFSQTKQVTILCSFLSFLPCPYFFPLQVYLLAYCYDSVVCLFCYSLFFRSLFTVLVCIFHLQIQILAVLTVNLVVPKLLRQQSYQRYGLNVIWVFLVQRLVTYTSWDDANTSAHWIGWKFLVVGSFFTLVSLTP